jgi:hypothetical protein
VRDALRAAGRRRAAHRERMNDCRLLLHVQQVFYRRPVNYAAVGS